MFRHPRRDGMFATQFNAIAVAAFFTAFLVSIASPAWASISYDIDKPLDKYGWIDQNAWYSDDYGNTVYYINNHGVACGPTATVNSFLYLQNQYGLDLNVDQLNPYTAINELGGYMNIGSGGVTDPNFISGKKKYLEEHGNGRISMKYQSVAVGGKIPDWKFIFDELEACEDVEVGFVWTGGGGHWVTATSFHFTDYDEDQIIDPNELAQLDFIDPWGGVHILGNLTMGVDGYLYLSYAGGGAGNGATGKIDIVVAESPIPEPATIAIWSLLGILALATGRRRRSLAK